jgi:hypothetical protein
MSERTLASCRPVCQDGRGSWFAVDREVADLDGAAVMR